MKVSEDEKRLREWAQQTFGEGVLKRHVVEGRLLFEAEILLGEGERPVPIYIEPPSILDRARARAEARKVAERYGVDHEKDPDLWLALDGFGVLAVAIRDRQAPFGQHRGLDNLLETYGKRPGCLERLADLLRVAESLADPRVPTLTDPMAWELVEAVRARGHLGPLAGIAGFEQVGFVIFMADRLLSYRRELSSKSSPSSSPTEP